jgi:hypothetical protein
MFHDELGHFHLLVEVLQALGSDPTAVTPSAEVHDVISQGLRAVLADPRMNLRQSLEAMLVAELEDNDAWQNLVRLAAGYHENALAERFQQCLAQERGHLARVRTWLAAGLSVDAFGDARKLFIAEPWVQVHSGPRTSERAAVSHRKPTARGKRSGNGKTKGNGARKQR